MKTFIVDAFTDKAFRGNPAGVCLTEQALSEELMLSIAKELNFSETAFVMKRAPANSYSIRYFSPVMEIPLCGHATLASSKVLFHTLDLAEIHFQTIQNIDLCINRSGPKIIMQFPVYELVPATAPQATLKALGLAHIQHAAYNPETKILLLEIASTEILGKLDPDFPALVRSHQGINGVLVTAASKGDNYDFHSRYFWPWSGTNEDPVTGGTHTFLAKYWAEKLAKTVLRSFQASARSGFMDLELLDDKLLIKSEGVIILEGELTV